MTLLRNLSGRRLFAAVFCAAATAAQIQGNLIDKGCEQRITAVGQPKAPAHTTQ
jgi:hypothetical protein